MLLLLIFFQLPVFADSVDQIQSGKFTEKTICSLCGGRILCGALSESISLENFSGNDTKSILNFCFLKTSELQSKSREHRPWISEEQKRHAQLLEVITKISTQSSTSKYTNEVLPTLKEKIQIRTNYRLENGFKLSEMKKALGAEIYKKWEERNFILPLLSFEAYSQIKGRNKSAYNSYVESLFIADVNEIVVEPSAYAFYYEGNTGDRQVASKTSINDITKDDLKKPHDYYSLTDINSFIEKAKLLPKEFCEKNSYKNVQQASVESLKKLSDVYGGDTSFEKAFHFRQLKKDFLQIIDSADCPGKMLTFLEVKIKALPNPQISQDIEKIQSPTDSRKPAASSTKDRKPVYCGFNIDNYQEECR